MWQELAVAEGNKAREKEPLGDSPCREGRSSQKGFHLDLSDPATGVEKVGRQVFSNTSNDS